MRGRTLSILGVLLTLSAASVSIEAMPSIAQEKLAASKAGLPMAIENKKVVLLPLKNEEVHEARRTPRLIGKQTTWRPIAVSARTVVTPPQPIVERQILAVLDQPDIQERHKMIANDVLRLLPVRCQQKINNFYVRYEKPERRGLAGKDTIILDGTLPDDEFRAVLIHEALGHVFDLGCLQGSALAGQSAFLDGSDPIFNDDLSVSFYRISWLNAKAQKPNTHPEDFVTGYAEADPFEDLAESAIYYILQNQTFTERARSNSILATKLKWFQTFLPVTPMPHDALTAAWDGEIPWDATKLPYEWKNTAIVARQ